jgi:hypothetical protein
MATRIDRARRPLAIDDLADAGEVDAGMTMQRCPQRQSGCEGYAVRGRRVGAYQHRSAAQFRIAEHTDPGPRSEGRDCLGHA